MSVQAWKEENERQTNEGQFCFVLIIRRVEHCHSSREKKRKGASCVGEN